ncbi:ribonuclease Z [Virgibacillus sp. SK37]|uniref:ribonuclease Z n=1 Tax=Virgibacillus sp. SK37 TaxID=403957 RepID=UPI0004D1D32B|nr:ribonuclease Z [Virgibacillus sp. SK37]AIF43501.1 ribonuclease Z [Virgibacillus sp. SK37]
MELIFLGTGAGLPSKERNVSSVALTLLQEQNNIWLFDCGEATQHQILRTSIKPKKINKIFITHLHGDHIFGLPGLLSSRSFQGGEELLTIYGPKGIKEYVNTSLELSCTHLTYPINVVELSEGKLYEDDQFVVETKQLDHGLPSFGFRIIEKDKPGELLVNKLKEIGVMPGPIYKQIKENSKVKLSNDQYIYRKDFIGEDKKGRIISILGDTRFTHVNSTFVKDSDVLVHEATFGEALQELAEKYYHSTTEQAAQLAKASNCTKLILTHLSSRYQSDDIENLLNEARRIFPNTEIADDFTHINI